jgi:hypothetical protein
MRKVVSTLLNRIEYDMPDGLGDCTEHDLFFLFIVTNAFLLYSTLFLSSLDRLENSEWVSKSTVMA